MQKQELQMTNDPLTREERAHKSQSIDIAFRKISYAVQVEDTSEHQSSVPCRKVMKDKLLLNNLSGICKAGKLTAIMGASGAGKTTLLNVLACRISSKKLNGSISANQSSYNFDNFGNFANYVMQQDILMETLTVRQTLELAANLKLNISDEDKKIRINDLVRQFKLEKCLDVVVGGHLLKGVSGGERKRTSIAFELISDPSVLMLDEPTSGLDSLTSLIIIRYLKQLTKKEGKTIFMTIHQPNSQIYALFDILFLMIEGRFIYQGSAADAPDYFSRHFGLKCGQYVNPADYFMSIMHHESKQNRERYPKYFETYEKQISPKINKLLDNEKTQKIVKRVVDIPFSESLGVLVKRDILNTVRNPMLLKSRIFATIFLAIFTSGVFYRFTGEHTSRLNWRSLTGFLFFLSISTMMNALNPVQLVFPSQRAVFLKEQGSKLYSTFSYFLSRNIVQLPASIIFPLIMTLIMYWFVGLSSTVQQFFIFYLGAYIITLNGISLGLMLGAMILDEKSVAVVTPIVLLPFFLFSGFFKNTGNLPSWIGWIQYWSPIKYCFAAWIENQVQFSQQSNIAELNLDTGLWLSIGLLFMLAVVFRFSSLFFLWMLRNRLQ